MISSKLFIKQNNRKCSNYAKAFIELAENIFFLLQFHGMTSTQYVWDSFTPYRQPFISAVCYVVCLGIHKWYLPKRIKNQLRQR